jgi:hypothetical protein
MLVIDALGPTAGKLMFQRFRLADSTERIGQRLLD